MKFSHVVAALVLIVVILTVWLFIAVRTVNGDPIPAPADPIPGAPSAASIPDPALELVVLRQRVRREHTRYLQARRRVHQLTRTLQHRSSTREAINLACVVYGSCDTLWRRARCETGGTLSPRALNRASGAAGLYQFLPSTWRSTPFARFSIWSPAANALAAGWMQANGRGSEWVCQ